MATARGDGWMTAHGHGVESLLEVISAPFRFCWPTISARLRPVLLSPAALCLSFLRRLEVGHRYTIHRAAHRAGRPSLLDRRGPAHPTTLRSFEGMGGGKSKKHDRTRGQVLWPLAGCTCA